MFGWVGAAGGRGGGVKGGGAGRDGIVELWVGNNEVIFFIAFCRFSYGICTLFLCVYC